MSAENEPSRLKVCCTCSYWSYKHKGFCHRQEQGVGKFWVCEDWSAVAVGAEGSLSEAQESVKSATLRA
jgi:hypothetical protein